MGKFSKCQPLCSCPCKKEDSESVDDVCHYVCAHVGSRNWRVFKLYATVLVVYMRKEMVMTILMRFVLSISMQEQGMGEFSRYVLVVFICIWGRGMGCFQTYLLFYSRLCRETKEQRFYRIVPFCSCSCNEEKVGVGDVCIFRVHSVCGCAGGIEWESWIC